MLGSETQRYNKQTKDVTDTTNKLHLVSHSLKRCRANVQRPNSLNLKKERKLERGQVHISLQDVDHRFHLKVKVYAS